MIRLIEELSYNAWPALHTLHYDGWVLRLAAGYTRRANSANPIYPSTLDLDEKIATVEAFYAGQGQRTVIKMTAAAQPQGLDEALAARGYAHDAPTNVQVLDALNALDAPTVPGFRTNSRLTDAWLADFCTLNNVAEQYIPTMTQMLTSIMGETGFLALRQDGVTVAVGLGVVERGYLGVYDLVTAAPYRRQGFGRQLMLGLGQWAREHGATRAYLQVMQNNTPARRLYDQLGFREVYHYWYRVRG